MPFVLSQDCLSFVTYHTLPVYIISTDAVQIGDFWLLLPLSLSRFLNSSTNSVTDVEWCLDLEREAKVTRSVPRLKGWNLKCEEPVTANFCNLLLQNGKIIKSFSRHKRKSHMRQLYNIHPQTIVSYLLMFTVLLYKCCFVKIVKNIFWCHFPSSCTWTGSHPIGRPVQLTLHLALNGKLKSSLVYQKIIGESKLSQTNHPSGHTTKVVGPSAP